MHTGLLLLGNTWTYFLKTTGSILLSHSSKTSPLPTASNPVLGKPTRAFFLHRENEGTWGSFLNFALLCLKFSCVFIIPLSSSGIEESSV